MTWVPLLTLHGAHLAKHLCGLRLGRDALEAMGIAHFRARDMVHTFRQHIIRAIESLRVLIDDDDKLVSAAKAGRDALYA